MFTGKKYDKLYRLMDEKNIAAVMIGPSGDLEYMTGYNPGGCERFQSLVITAGKTHFYICNELYLEDMQGCFTSDTKFYVWRDSSGWQEKLHEALDHYNLKEGRIAVGDSIRAVDLIDMKRFFPGEFVNGNEMLEEFRVIKSEEEIEKMRFAARLADGVMDEIPGFIRPGITEKETKERVVELFRERGADALSFTPIIASGPNSSRPHYCKDDRVIEKTDIIILDFGCKHAGFCSDISRTFFVGEISEKQREIYEIVQKAHDAAVSFAKEGATCGDVDKSARDVIEKAGYGDFFLNRTGHGIGFDVHEAPYIRGNSDQVLKKGMAFSIEPGIYLPGEFGMRIEDIVVINHKGETEVLNGCRREITVIK